MRKNKGEKVQHLLLQANLISLGKNSRLPGRTETQLVTVEQQKHSKACICLGKGTLQISRWNKLISAVAFFYFCLHSSTRGRRNLACMKGRGRKNTLFLADCCKLSKMLLILHHSIFVIFAQNSVKDL